MPRTARNESVVEAPSVFNTLDLDPYDFIDLERVRGSAREALVEVVQGCCEDYIDAHLLECARRGLPDRRNGAYERHLLTSLGNVVLEVPRTRTTSAAKVVAGVGRRRCRDVEQAILRCFLLGLSTRKVSAALLSVLGEKVSATTVSNIARVLDRHVAAFHERTLGGTYRALLFDGVVLKHRTGLGSQKRHVLVALGLRPDGKKELLDWRIESSESEACWRKFLSGLHKRGLTGGSTELVVTDGGQGLIAALEEVYSDVPRQRCWAHKARNLLNAVRKDDRPTVKRALQRIYGAPSRRAAEGEARRFKDRFEEAYPGVVRSLHRNIEELLAFFRFSDDGWRKATRTTNAIERRFVEVRRRTRPMGVFSDRTSIERILFAVFTRENHSQGIPSLLLLTQRS